MKINELKALIKDSVREAIKEELKDILLEAIKGNRQPVIEFYNKSETYRQPAPQRMVSDTPINAKQAYMDILKETAEGPKSTFDGEFKVTGHTDVLNGTLPEGQVGLDQIMGLLK